MQKNIRAQKLNENMRIAKVKKNIDKTNCQKGCSPTNIGFSTLFVVVIGFVLETVIYIAS